MNIPEQINGSELVVRIIFSPFHLNKSKTRIKANAFRSPPNKDEVSVLGFHYTSAQFCKSHGKKIELEEKIKNVDSKKRFWGLAFIKVQKIREINVCIRATPLLGLPMHADIYFNYIPEKGKPLPPEISLRLKRLAEFANENYFPDTKPDSEEWGTAINIA